MKDSILSANVDAGLRNSPSDEIYNSADVEEDWDEGYMEDNDDPVDAARSKSNAAHVNLWTELIIVFLVLVVPAIWFGQMAEYNDSFLVIKFGRELPQNVHCYILFSIAAAASYSLASGIQLTYLRDRRSVNNAIACLWIAGPFTLLLIYAYFPALYISPLQTLEVLRHYSNQIYLSLLASALCTVFLIDSEFVRGSYPWRQMAGQTRY
ncbi:MAG: hypothetical protein ACOCXA_02840 [Planctomycetota bacterium]